MTITIDVPDELKKQLSIEAERHGLPLSEYAVRVLSNRGSDTGADKQAPQSGSELVDFWRSEGVIGARPDIADAAEHARRLRREAEYRERS